jgi:hypothetical protein
VGEQAPGAATPYYDVEDGVKDLSQRVEGRTSGGFGSGKVRLQAAPFGVGEVGWIYASHACQSTVTDTELPLFRQFLWDVE